MALSKITADSLGANAVTANAISNTAIIAAVGYTPANKAGDTFTGNVVFSANATVTGVATFSNTTAHTGAATFSNTVAIGGDYITPYTGFKNRIINGAMTVAQRATSVTSGTGYCCTDRWDVASNGVVWNVAQSSDVPTGAGFRNSTSVTVTTTSSGATSYAYVYHAVEGYNWADMLYGTANALTTTLSFWVKSSIAGTYGMSFRNNGRARFYTTTYTINSVNTWEQKTIVIAGDTSGTWNTTNSPGFTMFWDLGIGSTYSSTSNNTWSTVGSNYFGLTGVTKLGQTNGATFYLTGVQLEKGSTATAFEYRDFGRELALCQRYYEKSYDYGTAPGTSSVLQQAIGLGIYTNNPATYNRFGQVYFKVAKRSGPTVVLYAPATGSSAAASNATSGDGGTNIGYCTSNQVNQYGFNIAASVGGSTNTNYYTGFFAFTAEAEL